MTGDVRAYGALLIFALVWGYNWVVIKIATGNADPFSVAAIRSVIGTLCLFATLIVMRRPLRPTPFWPTLVLGALQTTLFALFSVSAIAGGGAGKTAILVYTMPFWIVLLAWPILGERVSRSGWFVLALAALGLGCVVWPLDTGDLTAKGLAVASAIVWATSAIYGKLLRKKHPMDLLSMTTWQMCYGTLPLCAVAVAGPRNLHVTATFVAAIAYVGIAGTGLAWLLWMFVLSRLSASATGVASLLTPVVGVLVAWLELGERPNVLEFSGLCLIVTALFVNISPRMFRSRAASPTRA